MSTQAPGPSQLSDQDFAQFKDGAPAYGAKPSEISDTQFGGFLDQHAEKAAPGKPTITTLFGYLGAKMEMGPLDVLRSNYGADALAGGSHKDAQQNANMDRLKVLQKDTQAFEEAHGGAYGVNKLFGGLVESVPGVLESGKYAVAGAGAGAVIGAGYGAAAGAVLGPEAEPVSIPASAGVGALRGLNIGFGVAAAKLGAGNVYLNLLDQGVSEQIARPAALSYGLVSGLINTVGFGKLSAGAQKIFVNELSTEAGKASLGQFAKKYLADTGVLLTVSEIDQVAELTAETLAVMKNGKLAPGSDAWRKQFNDRLMMNLQALQQGLPQNVVGAAALTGVTHGGAKALGLAGRAVGLDGKPLPDLETLVHRAEMESEIDNSKVEAVQVQKASKIISEVGANFDKIKSAFELMKEAFVEEAPTTESLVEEFDKSRESGIDAVTKPLFDEQGNVIKYEEEKPVIDREVSIEEAAQNPDYKIETDAEGSVTIKTGAQENVDAPAATEKLNTPPEEALALEKEAKIRKNNVALPDYKLPETDVKKARLEYLDNDIAAKDEEIQKHQDELDKRDVAGNKEKLTGLEEDLARQDEYIAGLKKKKAGQRDTTATDEKLKTANKERKQLDKDITVLKARIEEGGAGSKATKALQAKVDALHDARETADTERQLLNEGLLTDKELGKSKGVYRTDQVLNLRAKAVVRIMEAFKKGFKKGEVKSRQDVKQVQTEITSLVRNADIDPAQKAALYRTVKNIQTPQQLAKRIPELTAKIEAFAEGNSKKGELQRFNKQLKQSKPTTGGKRPQGKFTADIQQILNHYRDAFKDPEFLERTANEVQNKQSEGTLTEADMLKAAIAEQVYGLGDKTAAEIKAINDDMQSLIEKGKAERLEKAVAKKAELNETVQTSKASIQGKDPRATVPEQDTHRVQSWKETTAKYFRSFGHQIGGWDFLNALAAQHDPLIAEGKNPTLVDNLSVAKAESHNAELRQQFFSELNETIKEALGAKGHDFHKAMEAGSKPQNLGEAVWHDQSNRPVVMTANEAIDFRMKAKDPGLRDGLIYGNGYTFEAEHHMDSVLSGKPTVEALVEAFLTDEQKALADALMESYQKLYEVVNEVYRENEGTDLPKNEFYSPAKRRIGGREDPSLGDASGGKGTLKPVSAITRVANAMALKPQDAILAAYHFGDTWAHYISHEEWYRKQSAVYDDPAVRYLIESKYGKQTLDSIDYQRADLARQNPKGMSKGVFKYFEMVKQNFVTAVIGARAVTVPRHFVGVLAYLKHVSAPELLNSLVESTLHPKRVGETLAQSAKLNSEENNLEIEALLNLRRSQHSAHPLRAKMNDLFLWGIQKPTQAMHAVGGNAVYKKVLRETGSVDQALLAAESATDEVGFSSSSSTRSRVQKEFPFAAALGTIPFKHAQVQLKAFRNAANHGSLSAPGPLLEAAKTSLIFGITLPLLGQVIKTRLGPLSSGGKPPEDNDDDLWIAGAGGVTGLGELPLVGEIFRAIAGQALNAAWDHKNRVWEPHTVLTSTAKNFIDGNDAMIDYAANPDADNFVRVLDKMSKVNYLLPPQAGGSLPVHTLVRFYEDLWDIDVDHKSKDNGSGAIDYDKPL